MSKKIILLGAIVMCTFIYGCGTQKNADEQQANAENLRVNGNKNDVVGIKEIKEIPVAEKNNGGSVEVQGGGRGGDSVEIDETFEEEIN